jgi:hypothetical protein
MTTPELIPQKKIAEAQRTQRPMSIALASPPFEGGDYKGDY